ncbi:MAG: hypothetical protein AUG51_20355 [Acidobacteria bacterium 13_1_20CM_3_53_8]|nr:MAG: hypothetical protein AUG51_20355 [Acidobacteria bacterium 13_1_20CM_3_53_8]
MNNKSLFQRFGWTRFCIILICLVVVGVSLRASSSYSAQVQDRIVEHTPFPHEPIQIVGASVSGKHFRLNERIDEDENWLKKLAITVKNVSPKTIIFINMYYDFPETKATGNIMAFPITYGRNPQAAINSGEAKRLLPGEAADLTLTDEQYAKLKEFLERRHPISTIKRASMRLTDVYFDDGTIWSNGSFYRIDPNNPHKLIPIENTQNVPSNN